MKDTYKYIEIERADLGFFTKDTKQISTKPTHPQLNKKVEQEIIVLCVKYI